MASLRRLTYRLMRAAGQAKAMTTSYKFPLLDLPNELIAHIIEQIESRASIRRLSRTCRRLQILAEPVLYRHVKFRSGARVERILNSIHRRRERAPALHILDFPADAEHRQNFQALSNLLDQATNLKEFSFESPECSTHDFEEEDEYDDMVDHLFKPFRCAVSEGLGKKPLQRLHKLVIHLNGCEGPYWTVNSQTLAIFHLPSLVHLTLSCVNILDDFAKDLEGIHFTLLKHLELQEANITHRGLHKLLSIPKALESLYLGENCHNVQNFMARVDPNCNLLFRNGTAAALAALSQQKHSLKALTYITPNNYFPHVYHSTRLTAPDPSPVDAGFVEFGALESITLVGSCPNFERAVMSSRPPPNLRHLKYRANGVFHCTRTNADVDLAPGHDSATLLSHLPFIRAPSSSIPKTLSNLDLVEQRWDYPSLIRDSINALAKAAGDIGVKLQVFKYERTHFFPPFLYGESVPQHEMIFDGTGFVNGEGKGLITSGSEGDGG